MLDSLRNIFAIADLRKRVLFTLGLLAVYRIGSKIPTPGINPEALQQLMQSAATGVFGLYDMFSGQNLSQMTIFALGIMPYISASIILQLLTVVWPYLEKLSKEGELGRRKITQYTRYGTILLAVIQSFGIAIFLERNTDIAGGLPLVYSPGWGFRFMTVLTLTTGSAFVMWLGEQITERGIGNGMSLIIYAGIVVGLPSAVFITLDQMRTGQIGPITIAVSTIRLKVSKSPMSFKVKSWVIPSGMSATMPAKMMSEMPLPMPRSVICSPSHIRNAVPVVRERTVSSRKLQPGSVTTSPPVKPPPPPRPKPSSQVAMKKPWTIDSPMVP
jgi:preprotein translocase subunit SecY